MALPETIGMFKSARSLVRLETYLDGHHFNFSLFYGFLSAMEDQGGLCPCLELVCISQVNEKQMDESAEMIRSKKSCSDIPLVEFVSISLPRLMRDDGWNQSMISANLQKQLKRWKQPGLVSDLD